MNGIEMAKYRADMEAIAELVDAGEAAADARLSAEADHHDGAPQAHWTDGLSPAELAAAVETGRIAGN